MNAPTSKASGALRTIGEISAETGLPHHVLRYWETRFPSLRPLQRAGNRRYYRPEDAALVRRIDLLLNKQGYTIRGVQQLLAAESGETPAAEDIASSLTTIRNMLADALAADVRRSGG